MPQTNNFYLNTFIINSYKSSSNRSVNSSIHSNNNNNNKKSANNLQSLKRNINNKDNNNNFNNRHSNNKLPFPNEPHMDSSNFEISSRGHSIGEQSKSKVITNNIKDNTNKLLIFIVDDHKFIRSTVKSLVNKLKKKD